MLTIIIRKNCYKQIELDTYKCMYYLLWTNEPFYSVLYKTKLNLSLVTWSKRCQYLMLVSHDHTYHCSLNIPYLFSHMILITQYFQWNTFCFKMPQYIMEWVQLSYTNYTFYQTVEASWPSFVICNYYFRLSSHGKFCTKCFGIHSWGWNI